MKGKWKSYSQVIGSEKLYMAGRQLDTSNPLHGGNVEYAGEYSENREAVVALCEELNEKQIRKEGNKG